MVVSTISCPPDSHWTILLVVSEGIRLTAYQRLGTIHLSRPVIQRRSGSDPSEVANTADLDVEPANKLVVPKDSTLRWVDRCSACYYANEISSVTSNFYMKLQYQRFNLIKQWIIIIKFNYNRRSTGSHATVTRSHSSLYGMTRPSPDTLITHPLNRTSSHGHLSFEEMCRANETKSETWHDDVLSKDEGYAREGVELLSQRDLTRLQPLLWLELTAVFDKYNVPLVKRKPNKRRRKGKPFLVRKHSSSINDCLIVGYILYHCSAIYIIYIVVRSRRCPAINNKY